MKIEGKDIEITIGGKSFRATSIEFGDRPEPPQLDRAPGVYVADAGTIFLPRYPGEGNRQQRRAAAKGKVRK